MRWQTPDSKPIHVSSYRPLAVACLLLLGACGSHFGEPPDFAAIEDVSQMKQAFYDYMQPVVEQENARILEQRQFLEEIRNAIAAGEEPGWLAKRRLHSLAKEYEISREDDLDVIVNRLWRRVDIVPVDLALVQAAKESGWGRSRFAVDHNNLFGQWCYEAGCGAVPRERRASATHEVEEFDSISEAVRRYVNNLNTHDRYAPLRRIRADRRERDQAITGASLAPGLKGYSERGMPYVEEVLSMMRSNRELLDDATTS
jgi:Bax protein